jgi:RNA polymerase-binding transcription factor DksA
MEADEIDRANELAAKMAESAVADLRNKAKPEQIQNEDGTWPHTDCLDCGGEIAPGRLALGKIRCIYCQSDLETGRRR